MQKVKIKGNIHPALHKSNLPCIPNFEAGAMAFIVVAMKLFYGIDDRTEREQERKVEPMESSSNDKSQGKIPLFTDWLKSWKCCEAKKLENGIPWTEEQFRLVRNPTVYTSFCKSDIFGSWEASDKVYTGAQEKNFRWHRTTNEESQQRYAQLFKSLMNKEREQEFSDLTGREVTSFPGTCSHVAGNEELNCFGKLRSRGINLDTVFEDDKDSKYICYSVSEQNLNSFHSSYQTLLNILADRIEMKAEEIQVKINKLEKALFFKHTLPCGFL